MQNSFKKDFLQYTSDFIRSLAYILYNFSVFTIFGVTGILFLYHQNKKMFYVFLIAGISIYGFSTFYAVTDNYVFFLPFNIIFALSIGFGLSKKIKWQKPVLIIAMFIPIFYLGIYNITLTTGHGKKFDNFKSYKGGLEYYMLPWMHQNKGILEFVIEKKTAPEPVNWMTETAKEYIEFLKAKGYNEEEIKKM